MIFRRKLYDKMLHWKKDRKLKKNADIIESQILPDARHYVELGTKYIDHKHIIEIKVNKGNRLYYM